MKKIIFAFVIVSLLAVNSFAFFMAVAEAAKTAKDEVYQKFMMIKAVEQLKTLRDNYESSMRYYAMMKKLNEGKGVLPNIAHRIGDIGDETYKAAQNQLDDDWITGRNDDSQVEKFLTKVDEYTSDKIKYAGKVFSKSREAELQATSISQEAESLDSKGTQKMILKTQSLQLQLAAQTNENMAQLLDVNTRLYKLHMDQKGSQMEDWQIFQKSIELLKAKKMKGQIR